MSCMVVLVVPSQHLAHPSDHGVGWILHAVLNVDGASNGRVGSKVFCQIHSRPHRGQADDLRLRGGYCVYGVLA
eukprot:CAMPEP_0115840012 /NCGR_PEP_ID=MMETSP0287-20121206/6552_1 /TAXON_ID=412157 /ORGANISM="Chrysochromulina rotalis, Strain UIO044" /LENGTH=73 /DNA_ID=CAMNT_0003293611 /DNA_START=647 /DNA_END=865 /DNA_ORIENTATION=+